MADILLDLGYDSKRLLLKSGDVSSAYQISYIYVKVQDGGFDFEIF